MKAYKQEIEDGLAEKLLATASIAFVAQVQTELNPTFHQAVQTAFASKLKSTDGLYHTKSILVSTVWNLNDDVFDPIEAWIAKDTPEDKPTNLGHDEKQIVGHITGNWPITVEGELISTDTALDELPEKFHIVNSAVIYTQWQDKDLQERTKALIEEIESDKKFVSMECVFRGFDYAVKSPDGSYHVLARNTETAFLTKHLRAYGGDGSYKGYRVGRLLRNITFSGKGYVDKPANPESIILKGEEFSFNCVKQNTMLFEDSGVSTNSTTSEIIEKVNIDMTQELVDVTKKLAESEAALVKAGADLKTSNDKLAELTKSFEDTKAEVKKLNDTLVAEQAKSAELTKTVEEITKAKTVVEAELSTIKAEAVKANRVAKLVDGGVAKDVAEAKTIAFVNFSDEQFNIVAEALITAAKANTSKPAEDIDTDPEGEAAAKAAAEAAAKAAAEAANQTIVNPPAEIDTKLEATRATISQYLAAQLGVE